MNIETLKELTGWKRPTINPTPTDLEIALARVNADHKSVLIAVKMLTEIAQSNAAAHLNMTVVHEERHAYVIKNIRELKKEVSAAESRHLTAFELALRPVTRAVDLLNQNTDKVHAVLVDKLNNMDADIHDLRAEIYADREAATAIQNTKLNAIALRIDDLCKILDDLVKYLGQKLVTPPPEPVVTTPLTSIWMANTGGGRPKGRKTRSPEERVIWLSDKIARAKPGSEAGKKFQRALTKLRNNMEMDK